MKTLRKITLMIIGILSLNICLAANCTAISTGNWSNPANWSCGAVPGCGDVITIPFGFTITVDINVNLNEASGCNSPTHIIVNGNLQMGNGKKMNFAAGSTVQIMPGGNLLKGKGGGHSNEINITGATSWIAGDGSKMGYFLIGNILPLPVEFKLFNVVQNENDLLLYWIVNSEINNNSFQVDISLDGAYWSSFGLVKSIGDHSTEHAYEIRKENIKVAADIIYFRLSQIDNDGERRELTIQSLKFEKKEFSIFPNPAKSGQTVFLNVQSEKQIESKIFVFNSNGLLMLSEIIYLEIGDNDISINVQQLQNGIYFVKTAESETLRLMIE